MKVLDKLFGKLQLGKCTVEVSSSNDIKPHAEVKGDTLLVTPKCKCGTELGTFEIDDHTSKIIESALVEKRIAEEHGKPLRVHMDDFSSIHCVCSECGREIHVSIHHTLTEKWLEDLNQTRTHAKETLDYGACLRLEIELKGAHLKQTRQPHLLSELVNPICACGTEITPISLRTAIETMIDEISRFWKESVEVKPKTVKIKEKCRFCLHDVKITAKLTPTLPNRNDSVQDIVQKFQNWKERMHA